MNANYIFPFDIKVHNECGALLLKLKRFDEAAREFKVTTEIEPRDKDALTGLVNSLVELKKTDDAQKAFDRLKRFYPDDDLSSLEKKLSGSK